MTCCRPNGAPDFRRPARISRGAWRFGAGASLLLIAFGCRTKVAPPTQGEPTASSAVPLKLLVIDDDQLADSIRRQWSTRGEGELQVVATSRSAMRDQGATLSSADAIVFPSSMMGDLIQSEYIVPLPEKILRDEHLEWRDVFELIRLREAAWDGRVMAIPLGSATPLLWYRAELWTKHGLAEPVTWTDYEAAIVKLREVEPGFAFGAAEPLADGWRGRMLLARAASYAHHRSSLSTLFDLDDMRALIGGPPFVRALTEMARLPGARESLDFDPSGALAELAAGRVPAAIGWWARDTERMELPETAGLIAVRLPGARQTFDRQRGVWSERPDGVEHVTLLGFAGRLGAVGRKARNARSAANLLAWLAGTEWSDQVLPASSATTLFRGRHRSALDRWLPPLVVQRSWDTAFASAVVATFQSPVFLESPRLGGEAEYLQALDEAVAKAVRGESTPEESLREAAAVWDAVTARLGRETQLAAYRKSLGL